MKISLSKMLLGGDMSGELHIAYVITTIDEEPREYLHSEYVEF